MQKKLILLPLLLMITGASIADDHEEPVTTMKAEGVDELRAEYNFCTLNKGKTFKDVEKFSQKYGDFANQNGLKYNQSMLTPIHAGDSMGAFTHVIVGHWPNGLEMYKEWGTYVNVFQEKYPNLRAPHSCGPNLATFQHKVVSAMDPTVEADVKRPVQYADCSLNEGKTLDDAKVAERAAAELIASAGMKGYGVNYIIPYLGQRDPDYDFISLSYFQTFMARAEMAYNYYKVADKADAITSEVYSCVNPRSFVVKNLYTNWDNS
jgi:hypothetical protein